MSAHFRPVIIESLQALWVALPVKAPAGEDSDPRERQMAIMEAYCKALRDISPEAVRGVVDALCEGRIKDASKRFCPTVPELAEYARDEQRRLDAFNRPKAVSYQPVGHQFIDWRIIHRQKAADLAAQGFTSIANVTIDDWHAGGLRRKWRVGSTWFWSISEVWSPSS